MVKLEKGQGVSLNKEAPELKRILIGLGWDPIKSLFGSAMDIDASVILINKDGRNAGVVYYGMQRDRANSVLHHGDNLTGDGDGDDEQIEVDLNKIPDHIDKLSIIINIFQAYGRRQDFGKVKNCFIHVMDMNTNKDLVHYDVDGNYNGKTGIFVADLYKHENEWKFKAIGEGASVADIDEMVQLKCQN